MPSARPCFLVFIVSMHPLACTAPQIPTGTCTQLITNFHAYYLPQAPRHGGPQLT